MKIQNNQSSYPGMADGYISYQGSMSTIGSTYGGIYGDGTYWGFSINTEIKNNLSVLIICSVTPLSARELPEGNIPVGLTKTFLLPYKVELTASNQAKIKVRVPSGCVANYFVSGDKNIDKYLTRNKELVEDTEGYSVGYESYGHKHDGIDSPKIIIPNLIPSLGNANKFLKVNNAGTEITYADASGSSLTPFTLATPLHYALLDMNVAQTNFSWSASTTATNYTIYICSEIERTIIYQNTANNVSRNVSHSNFEQGEEYYWYVVATDGTHTLQSNTRRFVTSIIPSS